VGGSGSAAVPGPSVFLSASLVRCSECGIEADDKARGWRAMLGEEDDGELMVGVFCPACAEREFGDHPLRVRRHNGRLRAQNDGAARLERMGTDQDIAAVAGQLAELTRAVEELTRQISGLRERSDVQEERADLQQDRIDVAATELHDIIERLENAANALRLAQVIGEARPDAPT
jgi:hypothetical protein